MRQIRQDSLQGIWPLAVGTCPYTRHTLPTSLQTQVSGTRGMRVIDHEWNYRYDFLVLLYSKSQIQILFTFILLKHFSFLSWSFFSLDFSEGNSSQYYWRTSSWMEHRVNLANGICASLAGPFIYPRDCKRFRRAFSFFPPSGIYFPYRSSDLSIILLSNGLRLVTCSTSIVLCLVFFDFVFVLVFFSTWATKPYRDMSFNISKAR